MVDLGKILGAGADVSRLQDVVDFIADHRDDLEASAQIARDLPALLRLLSSGLADAGSHASKAGGALSGASGATGRVGDSAEALADISSSLSAVGRLVGDAAIDISKVPLMGGPSRQLATAAHAVADTKKNLDGLAGDLKDISGLLDTVGQALERLGTTLGATGREANKFVGG
jgi:ABC-type transporter Mla subunit MlaD